MSRDDDEESGLSHRYRSYSCPWNHLDSSPKLPVHRWSCVRERWAPLCFPQTQSTLPGRRTFITGDEAFITELCFIIKVMIPSRDTIIVMRSPSDASFSECVPVMWLDKKHVCAGCLESTNKPPLWYHTFHCVVQCIFSILEACLTLVCDTWHMSAHIYTK